MNCRGCVALLLFWSAGGSTWSAFGQGTSGGGGVVPRLREGVAETRPFSALAIGLRVGLSGVGLEFATPLADRVNLRAGGDFLSVDPHLHVDGVVVNGAIQLRSGFAAVDFFPFHDGFRISPGFTLYNGNHLSAQAVVPGGLDFDLGDGTYTSGVSDPVHGRFDLSLGRKSAPRVTVGWGNMIPRQGGHWSFPFELGAEYVGERPAVTLTLAGTVCQGPGFCQPIDQNPTATQNVTIEQNQINGAIPSWLRFSPLISTGVSFRFGRVAGRGERPGARLGSAR